MSAWALGRFNLSGRDGVRPNTNAVASESAAVNTSTTRSM
jgi:hypothetical protein